MTDEKKPCPFCGSMKTSVETFDECSEYWAVWCPDCKCTGPLVRTDLEIDSDGLPPSELSEQAFEAWNKRDKRCVYDIKKDEWITRKEYDNRYSKNGSDNTMKNGSDN